MAEERKNGYQSQFAVINQPKNSNNQYQIPNDIFDIIIEEANFPCIVERIGIQADPGTKIQLGLQGNTTNISITIGKTGIYEVGGVEINSIIFDETTPPNLNTIIDYIIKEV